jgi:hypothetical protein
MTQDEIIEMANQSRLFLSIWIDDEGDEIASLVAFAKLIEDAAFKRWAAQTKLAVQDERDACAQVAFSWNTKMTDQVAEEIRNRGEK